MIRLRLNFLMLGLIGLVFLLFSPGESFGQCQGCIACDLQEPPWTKQCGEVVSGKLECEQYDPCSHYSVCHPSGGGGNVPLASIQRGIDIAQKNGPSTLDVSYLYGGEAVFSGSISLELPPAHVPVASWLAARSPCDQWPPRPLLADRDREVPSRAGEKSARVHR